MDDLSPLHERAPVASLSETLFDASPLGIVISRGGCILYVNHGYRRMYGVLDDAPIAGLSILEHVAACSRDAVSQRNARRERHEPAESSYEVTGRRSDGSHFYVHISAGRVDLPDGPATIAFIEDITHRRSVQTALRQSEQKYRAMAENSVVGIWHITPDRRSIYLNPAMMRMLEIESADELNGKDIDGFFTPESAERTRRELLRRPAGESSQYEVELVGRGGTHRFAVISGAPVMDGEGALQSIIGTFTDITDLKRAEIECAEAEQRFRLLFEASPHGIIVIEPHEQRVVQTNEAARRILGVPENEARGLRIPDFEGKMSADEIHERIRGILARGGDEFETSIRQKDGELREVHVSVRMIELDGRPLLYCMVQDTTEQNRLRAQLLQSQKMEAVGVLAGGIAHDFNNLLAVISGYSESLTRRLGPDHELACNAAEIQRAADRGEALVRQLLAFSRRQVVEPRIIDLARTVGGLEEMLRRLIRHEIELRLAPLAPGLLIRADPGHIEQIIINLALNARDAMPAGGSLTIAVERFEAPNDARTLPAGAYARLRVTDTGVGMDEEIRRRMFEPFFTTKGARGTGLGLAVVYGVIQQYGGIADVQSAPGKGTQFDIFLPLAQGQMPAPK